MKMLVFRFLPDRILTLLVLLLCTACVLQAQPKPRAVFVKKGVKQLDYGFDDISKADADGPLVFYRSGNVVVKSIERRDSSVAVVEKRFANRNTVPTLVCHVAETDDRFSFQLRPALTVQPDEYAMPDKMLVLSDIEGNFGAFKMLLQGTKVMDENFKWTFGKGHLVLVGDFFDRGLNVTEVLWLIYKLETEAEAAGGKVHFVLGNHEILNLEGYTQYVRNKYIENAALLREPYAKWYAADTELGRWLRTKNAVERIGDVAFCHGGISTELMATGVTVPELNKIAREYLGVQYEKITDPLAQQVFDSKTGIFWYRGIAKKEVDLKHVKQALGWAGASRLVVGHTLMSEITAIYNGKVVCVDLYHAENYRQGFMKSLWIENGAYFEIDHEGEKNLKIGN